MTPAFWDASSLVPLCVQQSSTQGLQRLSREHSIVVWWATSLEMRSALQRLLRIGSLTAPEHSAAAEELEYLRRSWREVQPSEAIRRHADAFLLNHPLKAADALQLAAAFVWSSGDPRGRLFISGDVQLANAARNVGFRVAQV